jgi:hypothetical protein
MNYRKVNNLVGWITGAIAYIVFLRTMEPTASFWDCGEFLSCAYKLEVGHSPGAPFFMMVQRIFGLLAGSNVANAAWFINSESALTSGLTILFLFWTITHFAKKLLVPKGLEPDTRQILLIMGAGLVGGLAYTFSDTFWFSAVEAEVYATSSFFTAITFWAIFKWENVADTKYADRWLILISYLIGISVCVHLLNLLTIPAIAMVYYYKRYETTTMGAIIAFLVGGVILGIVQFGIIQYVPIFASRLDVAFVNNMGLPLDSGAITFIVLLCAGLVWLLFFARRRQYYLLHTGVLCVLFIIIGYSSYIVPIIRSRADVPIDMTNPDNVISFVSYVDREQFGQQPLFSGPDFTSQPTAINDKGPMYYLSLKDGKAHYDVVGKKLEPEYDGSQTRIFPRIWDNNDPMHINFYKSYLGLNNGETPTSADNLKYFFSYQMNWMWWRYFMWNYAGRENDVEGQGDPKNGNWVSGIKFLDMPRVGDMDKMPDGFVNNGARNQLYFLPLILGICGLVYQFNRKSKDGMVILVLFFLTGAAIGIFLNMPPVQPRERDYAYAGCTYAFAIWIGLGVLLVEQYLSRVVKGNVAAILTTALCLLLVPVLMARVEWNDHDRSNKTLARAVAYNTLQSCAPNAVLFTAGDNQTYPLWYIQEVEGVRKDVRIINTSLLGIDWYIDQLNYRVNDADAIPMIWTRDGYVGDHSNYIRYFKSPQVPADKYISLSEICKFISSADNANKLQTQGGEWDNYFPTKNFFVPTISKGDLVKNGLAKAEDTALLNTDMKFTYPKDIAYKNDISILNIVAGVASQGWKRPIYFDAGLPTDNYAGLADYLRLEGLVYRVMPYKSNDSAFKNQQLLGSVDLDKTCKLFQNYIWGGADKNNVYFDEPNRREFMIYRMDAAFTANVLTAKGKTAQADSLLNIVYKGITEHSCYYDYTGYLLANAYYRCGDKKMGGIITQHILKNTEDNANYILTLSDDAKPSVAGELNNDWSMLRSLYGMAMMVKDTTTTNILNTRIHLLEPKLKGMVNMGPEQQ